MKSANKPKQSQKQPRPRRLRPVPSAEVGVARRPPVKRPGPNSVMPQRQNKSELYKSYRGMAQQLILPGSTQSIQVLPNTTPSQVCARQFRRVVTVNATAATVTAFMSPDLQLPGFINQGGDSTSLPTQGVGIVTESWKAQLGQANGTADYNTCTGLEGKASCGSEPILLRVGAPQTDNAERTIRSFRYIVGEDGVAGSFSFSIKNAGYLDIAVGLAWKFVGGSYPWNVFYQSGNIPLTTKTTSLAFTAGAKVVDIGIFSMGRAGAATLSVTGTNVQALAAAGLYYAPAFEAQVLDDGIVNGRVTAMSMLVQDATNVLEKKGEISIGRVPNHFQLSSRFDTQMSALPKNRAYIGNMQDGGYATWLPSQQDETELNNVPQMYKAYKGSEFLAAQCSGIQPNVAVIRFTFVWCVEFYTPNQGYEKVLTPPCTPEWQAIRYALLLMDAASCNPSHIENAKAIARRIKSALEAAYGFYNEHEVLFKLLGAAATSLIA